MGSVFPPGTRTAAAQHAPISWKEMSRCPSYHRKGLLYMYYKSDDSYIYNIKTKRGFTILLKYHISTTRNVPGLLSVEVVRAHPGRVRVGDVVAT